VYPRKITAAAALLSGAALLFSGNAAVAAPAEKGQKSSYIVTVSDGENPRGIARAVQANPNFVFSEVLDGFAAQLNAGQLRALRNHPAVTAVEADQSVTAAGRKSKRTLKTILRAAAKNTGKGLGKNTGKGLGKGGGKPVKEQPVVEEPVAEEPVTEPVVEQPTTQQPTTESTQKVSSALWGLDRINQRLLPLDSSYSYVSAGTGVTAYVVDSGIATSHPDFEGRAKNVFDAFGGTGQDCNGHGTHVAGTIGGETHGVAKDVVLAGVRVLDCNGSGSYSGVIAGLDWIAANSPGPAVANLSLGGGYSSAMNTAVKKLSDSGVTVVVAAGNSNVDAGTTSPASTPEAITVAASDRNDQKASFSNYGSVVDTYAPGVSITSTSVQGGSTTMSGTSMAAPHVAGVAVLYKAVHGDAASDVVHSWVVQNATASVVGQNPAGTPNRLLFKGTL
jgi:subtilisin family serine protease